MTLIPDSTQPRKFTAESIFETLSALIVVAPFVLILKHWPRLPEQIPTHFNILGEPDAWGPRSFLWLTPATAILVYISLSVLTYSPAALALVRLPQQLDRNNPEVRRLTKELLILSKILIGLLIFEIVGAQIQVAQALATELKIRGALAFVVGLVLLPPIYLIRLKSATKAP